MITSFAALILGLVEGLTEFLPISSTAHLILTAELLGISQSDFVKTFEIAIQSGAILAVVALYWRKLLDLEVIKRVAIAFVPTGIIGLTLYKVVKEHLIGNVSVVLWALAIGGVLLILFEKFFIQKGPLNDVKEITYKKSFMIGIFQAIAMIPGVSRSAATIIGGMLVGVGRSAIVEFSFLLAVPTLIAATGLDLVKNAGAFSASEAGVLMIGFISSFVTALISIKFLLGFIRNHSFVTFGVYRIALVAVWLAIFI